MNLGIPNRFTNVHRLGKWILWVNSISISIFIEFGHILNWNMHLIELNYFISFKDYHPNESSVISKNVVEITNYLLNNQHFVNWFSFRLPIKTKTKKKNEESRYQMGVPFINYKIAEIVQCQIFDFKYRLMHVYTIKIQSDS